MRVRCEDCLNEFDTDTPRIKVCVVCAKNRGGVIARALVEWKSRTKREGSE